MAWGRVRGGERRGRGEGKVKKGEKRGEKATFKKNGNAKITMNLIPLPFMQDHPQVLVRGSLSKETDDFFEGGDFEDVTTSASEEELEEVRERGERREGRGRGREQKMGKRVG